MKTVYDQFALGLELSHRALDRNLVRFGELAARAAPAPANLGPFLALFAEFLEVHHAGEDRFLFPALRREAAGRSTDAAHLARWDGEHVEIRRLARELERLAQHVELAALGRCSQALRDVLGPHTHDEEAVLTAGHLPEMIPERELAAALQNIQKANRSRALAMASFLASSLEPAEQHALMGEAPWLFRRVILPWVGARKMKPFRDLVHTQEIAP